MATATDRVFRRTAAGNDAHETEDLSIPSDFRRILAVVDGNAHFDVIRGCLRQYPDELLAEWLDELVELGMLESVPGYDELDLDFTNFFATATPAPAATIPEDRLAMERASGAVADALARTGAYLSEERLRNRGPAKKRAADTVVLIVEDDPDQLALADLRLTMAGYRVRSAPSASAMVESLRDKGAPDVLLLDVMLPDGDGFQILGRMRHHPKLALLPIVMLTAKDDPQDVGRGLELGADGYVTKPYSKNILVDTLQKVLKHAPPGNAK